MGAPLVSLAIGYGAYTELAKPSPPSQADSNKHAAMLSLLGAALLLVGEFGVTAGCNVPLNDQLKDFLAQPNDGVKQAALFFKDTYLVSWTFWNTVRTVASAGTATCYALALRLSG